MTEKVRTPYPKTNEIKITYVAPEMIYTCPMTGKHFYSYEKYCRGNPPCLYFNSIKKDGYGDVVYFDLILCEYRSSPTTTNGMKK